MQPALAADSAAGEMSFATWRRWRRGWLGALPSPIRIANAGRGGGGGPTYGAEPPPTPSPPLRGGREQTERVARPYSAPPASAEIPRAFAAAGGRDQQSRAAGAGLGKQFQLMRARRPAAAFEPAGEAIRQQRRFDTIEDGHHGLSSAAIEAGRGPKVPQRRRAGPAQAGRSRCASMSRRVQASLGRLGDAARTCARHGRNAASPDAHVVAGVGFDRKGKNSSAASTRATAAMIGLKSAR